MADKFTLAETPAKVDPGVPAGITSSDPVVISSSDTEEVLQVVTTNDEVTPTKETEEAPTGDTDGVPDDAPTTPTTEAVEAKGFDIKALSEEYQANGGLTEETYQKLGEKGFTKEMVDTYIEGQKAIAERYNQTLAEKVGGKETLDAVLEWASKNLSEAEKAVANQHLASGNADAAGLVLEGLKARYQATNGAPPKLVSGQPTGNSAGSLKPFESAAQLSEAIRNPKYQTDPAYRDKVMKRLAMSEL